MIPMDKSRLFHFFLVVGCILVLAGFLGHYLTDAFCITSNNSETIMCQNGTLSNYETVSYQLNSNLHTNFSIPTSFAMNLFSSITYGFLIILLFFSEYQVTPLPRPPKNF